MPSCTNRDGRSGCPRSPQTWAASPSSHLDVRSRHPAFFSTSSFAGHTQSPGTAPARTRSPAICRPVIGLRPWTGWTTRDCWEGFGRWIVSDRSVRPALLRQPLQRPVLRHAPQRRDYQGVPQQRFQQSPPGKARLNENIIPERSRQPGDAHTSRGSEQESIGQVTQEHPVGRFEFHQQLETGSGSALRADFGA